MARAVRSRLGDLVEEVWLLGWMSSAYDRLGAPYGRQLDRILTDHPDLASIAEDGAEDHRDGARRISAYITP